MNNTSIICYPSQDILDLADPKVEHIHIEDIAHHLSRICRFSGAGKIFYSVALHSYILSYLVKPEYALSALLHDAAETYIGDNSTPKKNLIHDLVVYELIILEKIYEKHKIPFNYLRMIRQYDHSLTWTEAEYLDLDRSQWPDYYKPQVEIRLNYNLEKYLLYETSWRIAKAMFLTRFEELHTT